MDLQYTRHARDQMILRAVTSAEVEQVIADPDITYLDQYGNPCYIRWVAGRRIRVVVAGGSNPPRIVTVIS
jgi:hypothetical protein